MRSLSIAASKAKGKCQIANDPMNNGQAMSGLKIKRNKYLIERDVITGVSTFFLNDFGVPLKIGIRGAPI